MGYSCFLFFSLAHQTAEAAKRLEILEKMIYYQKQCVSTMSRGLEIYNRLSETTFNAQEMDVLFANYDEVTMSL